MKIIAVIMVYDCGDVVLEALKSIDGKVDEVHCFDSLWKSMRGSIFPHSTDDTKLVIESFALVSKSKVTYTELPSPEWESKARTLSIENIEEGDWVFVIDSDERVTQWCDVRSILEQSNELAYSICMNGTFFSVCRLYKKVKGMHYGHGDRIHLPKGEFYDTRIKMKAIEIDLSHKIGNRKRVENASGFRQGPHP